MLINPNNVLTLLTVLFRDFHFQQSQVTNAEQDLANTLYSIIISSMNDAQFTVEDTVSLDIDTSADFPPAQVVDLLNTDDDEFGEAYEDEDEGDYEVCADSSEQSQCAEGSVDIAYKTNAVMYWKSGKKKKLTLAQVQRRYRKVKSTSQLYRWDRQIFGGGSRFDKLQQISQYVFRMFQNARTHGTIVHDHDLRRWAHEAQETIQAPQFEASNRWVQKFKTRHFIVSRKITMFQTKVGLQDETNIKNAAQLFVTQIRSLIPEYGLDNIWNTDQSGMALELHSGRTLSEVGIDKVRAVIQSMSATTHTYTIQPLISASGHLSPKLLIVLKEVQGQLGPRVQASMFRPPNLVIMASKSGKLTKQHFQQWFTDVYCSNTGTKTLLILDSWGGQRRENVDNLIPKSKEIKVMTIPPGGTRYVQPLDVYGFRLWKQFLRQFSDTVILSQYDCNLHSRDNILKLQSLIHNQFSSPRYIELFKYSWYKSGYLDERPEQFQTPLQFCFSSDADFRCDICGQPAIVRCSWCKRPLCFKHFFNDYHYCHTYTP